MGALTLSEDEGLQESPFRGREREELQEQKPCRGRAAEAKLVLFLAQLWEKPMVAMNPSPLDFTCQVLQVFLSFSAQPEGKQW